MSLSAGLYQAPYAFSKEAKGGLINMGINAGTKALSWGDDVWKAIRGVKPTPPPLPGKGFVPSAGSPHASKFPGIRPDNFTPIAPKPGWFSRHPKSTFALGGVTLGGGFAYPMAREAERMNNDYRMSQIMPQVARDVAAMTLFESRKGMNRLGALLGDDAYAAQLAKRDPELAKSFKSQELREAYQRGGNGADIWNRYGGDSYSTSALGKFLLRRQQNLF